MSDETTVFDVDRENIANNSQSLVKCAICQDVIAKDNISFVDLCLHQFCFECLKSWCAVSRYFVLWWNDFQRYLSFWPIEVFSFYWTIDGRFGGCIVKYERFVSVCEMIVNKYWNRSRKIQADIDDLKTDVELLTLRLQNWNFYTINFA